MRHHQVRVSDERLIRALHRNAVEIGCAAYALALAYACLVPFDFKWSVPDRAGPGLYWRLHIAGANIPDIFANIGVYLPLGGLAFLVFRRRRLGAVTAGALAILGAAGMSFALESAQYYVGSRVPSWADVVANVLGAWLGATLVGFWHDPFRRAVHSVRAAARRNWWLAVGKVAVCLILVVHLRPFDVVVDMLHTAAAIRRADVSPVAAWHHLGVRAKQEIDHGRREGMHELARMQWEYGLDRFAETAGYAGLAVLLALGLAPRFRSRARRDAWIVFVVVSLAMVVTCMRAFLISHGLDTAHFVCGFLGAVIGCGMARVIGDGRLGGPGSGPRRGERPDPSIGLVNVAIAVSLAIVVLYELVPFDFGSAPSSASTIVRELARVPFIQHFHSRPNDALYDISGEFLRYAVVGVCLFLLLVRMTRWSWSRQLASVVLAAAALATIFEVVHLGMAARHADITTVLIAVAGGFVGGVGVRWARDYRAYLSIVVVEDALTRQLIEGESFDKTALSRLGSRHNDASPRAPARSSPRD